MGETSPQRRRQLRSFAPAGIGLLQALAQPGAEPSGQPLLDLASNDTLALASHPALATAAIACIQSQGVGAGASRLVSGSRPEHRQLEAALAEWLQRPRVLLFPSGFQANLAAVAALADRHSLVLADRLIHHSLLQGVRACGARLQRFRHNDLSDLERRLQLLRQHQPQRRLVVLSESLFSMAGTSPDVAAMAALCQRHGASLLLDEAHGLGLLGPGGRGLGYGQAGVAMVCGTLGKAFASGGAFLATDAELGEQLLQHSGAFRYTTALAPPLAAAALAALELIRGPEGESRRQQLQALCQQWRQAIAAAGWPRPAGSGPILALKLGSDQRALDLQAHLEQAGLLAVAIRPPTVPEGQAQLRISLRPGLPADALPRLLASLNASIVAAP